VDFAPSQGRLKAVSRPLYSEISAIIVYQDVLFWKALDLNHFIHYTQVVADLEGFVLLGVLTSLVALSNRGKGTGKVFLLSLQFAALCLVILGVEIAVFEPRVLYLHVTDAQVALRLAPWFNNADLLFSAVAVFAVSSSLSRLHGLRFSRGGSNRGSPRDD
jgi:hypothetical protein